MVARQNQFEQRKSMDFITFALGITIYKPKPEIGLDQSAAEHITQDLWARIDLFFNDYDNSSNNGDPKYRWYLKVNIHKFVQALLNRNGQAPRYLCLYGPQGIGKTHFVNELCKWMEELISDGIRLEELVITSAGELEGSEQRPGAILRVLRNQLMANKRGSVVFMDEATWLNRDDMISPSKRIFNGDQAKLSTSYFGGGVDGTGLTLELPPMLIFVAMNEEIKDPALKSRFDYIHYPSPKQEALTTYALALAKKSAILHADSNMFDRSKIDAWIQSLDISDRNFRYVSGNIEALLCDDSTN